MAESCPPAAYRPASLFVGVDGGGTRCRVRLRDAHGHLLAESEGGPANVSLDFASAVATIRGSIDEALRAAGLAADARDGVHVGLGLAGVSSAAIAERVAESLPGFGSVVGCHDGVAACLGAHRGEDGGLVIAGTGSAAVLRVGGQSTSIGGRGFLLGDDGSGAWIGRLLLRLALRACDELEPASPLTDEVMRGFGRDPVAVIGWARTAPSHAFAAFAPRVFAAAEAGDAAAMSIVGQAAAAVSELVEAVAARGASRISLVGGMAEAIAPYLTRSVRSRLKPALADACEGALLLAGLPRER